MPGNHKKPILCRRQNKVITSCALKAVSPSVHCARFPPCFILTPWGERADRMIHMCAPHFSILALSESHFVETAYLTEMSQLRLQSRGRGGDPQTKCNSGRCVLYYNKELGRCWIIWVEYGKLILYARSYRRQTHFSLISSSSSIFVFLQLLDKAGDNHREVPCPRRQAS